MKRTQAPVQEDKKDTIINLPFKNIHISQAENGVYLSVYNEQDNLYNLFFIDKNNCETHKLLSNTFPLTAIGTGDVTVAATDSTVYLLENGSGKTEVTLIEDQLPAHDHTSGGLTAFNRLSARAADIDSTNTPGSADSSMASSEYRVAGMSDLQWQDARIKSVGLNEAHENRPPYFVLAYIIKVK